MTTEQMLHEILETVPHSDIVVGKGAVEIRAYPPPGREPQSIGVAVGTIRECVEALHRKHV